MHVQASKERLSLSFPSKKKYGGEAILCLPSGTLLNSSGAPRGTHIRSSWWAKHRVIAAKLLSLDKMASSIDIHDAAQQGTINPQLKIRHVYGQEECPKVKRGIVSLFRDFPPYVTEYRTVASRRNPSHRRRTYSLPTD